MGKKNTHENASEKKNKVLVFPYVSSLVLCCFLFRFVLFRSHRCMYGVGRHTERAYEMIEDPSVTTIPKFRIDTDKNDPDQWLFNGVWDGKCIQEEENRQKQAGIMQILSCCSFVADRFLLFDLFTIMIVSILFSLCPWFVLLLAVQSMAMALFLF